MNITTFDSQRMKFNSFVSLCSSYFTFKTKQNKCIRMNFIICSFNDDTFSISFGLEQVQNQEYQSDDLQINFNNLHQLNIIDLSFLFSLSFSSFRINFSSLKNAKKETKTQIDQSFSRNLTHMKIEYKKKETKCRNAFTIVTFPGQRKMFSVKYLITEKTSRQSAMALL